MFAARMPSSVWVGGIRMSARTTSGPTWSTSATSESWSWASCTSSTSGCSLNRADSPRRSRALSSASTTRIPLAASY
ncbi:hypothetical protein ASG78_14040 [Nostocoides sp. Soil756]|nr:hypothetical protein ASG78_14040 [Tetrasphaera sp. Soil756]